jgi:hypothetical protein
MSSSSKLKYIYLSPLLSSPLRCTALQGYPVVATEQYPKALGGTVPDIASALRSPAFTKKSFSMLTEEVVAALRNSNAEAEAEAEAGGASRDYVICGIESHVCVLQTVTELSQGPLADNIYVVCDAVSSQR